MVCMDFTRICGFMDCRHLALKYLSSLRHLISVWTLNRLLAASLACTIHFTHRYPDNFGHVLHIFFDRPARAIFPFARKQIKRARGHTNRRSARMEGFGLPRVRDLGPGGWHAGKQVRSECAQFRAQKDLMSDTNAYNWRPGSVVGPILKTTKVTR